MCASCLIDVEFGMEYSFLPVIKIPVFLFLKNLLFL